MDGQTIRRIVLEVVNEIKDQGPGYFQQDNLLKEIAMRLDIKGNGEAERALLTYWQDLFRSGYLAWGYNLSNPNPPFVHITEKGRIILENLSRDPANPDGYLSYLRSKCSLNPVAESYIQEALITFNNNCFKASAVMVGATAESMVLELRESLVNKMGGLNKNVPPQLKDWKVKTVYDQIEKELNLVKKTIPHKLRESLDSFWSALFSPIRMTRNEAGHPTSISPVTFETVHSTLLILPELAALIANMKNWIEDHYQ